MTLVNKTTQVLGVPFHNTSPVYCMVCSPPQVKSSSIIYPCLTLFHLPPLPWVNGILDKRNFVQRFQGLFQWCKSWNKVIQQRLILRRLIPVQKNEMKVRKVPVIKQTFLHFNEEIGFSLARTKDWCQK